MTRQEQYDKLNEASKKMHDALRLIREARQGGDNRQRPFFGRIQTAHSKGGEARELLAETLCDLRNQFPLEVK